MARAKGIRAAAAIGVVEAAYQLNGSEGAWLESVLEQAAGDLDTGCGVYGFTGNDSAPDFAKSPVFVQRNLSAEFLSRIATLSADRLAAVGQSRRRRNLSYATSGSPCVR